MRPITAAFITLLLCLTGFISTASALSPPEPPRKASSIGFGLNLRTDLGTHPLRLDLVWRTERTDLALVLDPMFWTDGQSSTDLIMSFLLDNTLQPLVGWRLHTIKLPEARQLQHNLVAGLGLALPSFWKNRLKGQWGFELATTIVKHGGNLPAETISFASARNYLDLVNFGMFARFDFHIPLGGVR